MADGIENKQPARVYPLYKPQSTVPAPLSIPSKPKTAYKKNTYAHAATSTSIILLDQPDINGQSAAFDLFSLAGQPKTPFLLRIYNWSLVLDGTAYPAASHASFNGFSWFLFDNTATKQRPYLGDSPYIAGPISYIYQSFALHVPDLLYHEFDDINPITTFMKNVLLDGSVTIINNDAAPHNDIIWQSIVYDVLDVPSDIG